MAEGTTVQFIPDGAQASALAALHPEHACILFICRDEQRMAILEQAIPFFAPGCEVVTFPAWDCLPYDRISPNPTVVDRRLMALGRLHSLGQGGKPCIVLTTVNAVQQRVLPREMVASSVLAVKSGDKMKRETLTHYLVENGYAPASTVSEAGDFATRGSLLDIFPTGAEAPYRLDFFGDELESIRTFDPVTQVTTGNTSQFILRPASEVLLTHTTISHFKTQYHALFGAVLKEDPLYEAVTSGRRYPGVEHWQPLFYTHMETLFDYLPQDVYVVTDHLTDEARQERQAQVQEYYQSRADDHALEGSRPEYKPVPMEQLYLSEREWVQCLSQHDAVHFSAYLPEEGAKSAYRHSINYAAESQSQKISVFDYLKNTLDRQQANVIACVSEGSRARMQRMLEEHAISCRMVDTINHTRADALVWLAVLPLEHGFVSEHLRCITEQDLLGEKIARTTQKRKANQQFFAEMDTLAEGELVVHKEHGIGRFEGLKILEVAGEKHDCLLLVYAGEDKLYVPVENSDLITRYGAADEMVELDKLGGLAWQKRKAKLKKRIQISAAELLKIAAARRLRKATAFEVHTPLYHEFCARFPYPETDDQLQSIEDVENDLAASSAMDRLVCGDVGFGKTEVALRAAFLAAQPRHDGEMRGQVAVITPTTLLCRQHYETFRKRCTSMPYTIRQLSRLVGAKETRETREMMEAGQVDILIGTHALLSRQTQFKHLVLLIVDEEQHFGVAQKEKLKKLRAETHVLTLTATPIPRTLQMALTGIRDLSIIATPPIDRLAVRTYVMPYDPVITREAILREHYRGGSTFYVCPRIMDLGEVEKRLRKLVPEVKIAVAHGQLPPEE
ncbi:MAG: DEAD/DEAH box helicase, partial [Rickettsiales bacterium]|nr:DEAD/DEAH box helicase [Rickettsiales bacterium]